ncbi:MAG: hypothetical protein F4029_01480 [Gammaproteobacteria bacterium]|nr:hypothetical protein [Gammaproteobacteria bacterium]MYF31447.1 hypothetical protein [Gammaproteobacteria bacterium]MYK44880.1 hypothetical protein [Gammaproteobacteria bacterium]
MAEPIGYMERTRRYYEAQGFEKAYAWANFDDIPFTPLRRPASESTLVLITTMALYDRGASDVRHVASCSTLEPPARLYGDDLSWDRTATHLNDRESYFPINMLHELVRRRRIGALAERFHCAPTEYSQRRTRRTDAPEILKRCREDGADIALLVPI